MHRMAIDHELVVLDVPSGTARAVPTRLARPDVLEHSRALRRPDRTKRLLDLVVAASLLVVLLPVLLLVAVAVAATSRGPAVFVHQRVGRDGRRFGCLKFRTMRHDAPDVLEDVLRDPARRAEFDRNHKLQRDPRVTGLGHVLRSTSIDELPQLVNVLAGDMSLVGPRPVVDDELSLYGGSAAHYLAVRPGITGPWQVSGRSDTTFAERVAMDRAYVEQHSLRDDARLLLRTPIAALRGTGAY